MHKRSIARIFQIWWIDNDSFSCSLCFCLTISSTSSFECSLSTSVNLLYVHPLFFLPGSSIFNIACPIYPLSLLYMCPNHLRLESLTLCQPKRLMYPFLVLSIRVTANKNLQLFQLQLGLLSLSVSHIWTMHHSRSHWHLLMNDAQITQLREKKSLWAQISLKFLPLKFI